MQIIAIDHNFAIHHWFVKTGFIEFHGVNWIYDLKNLQEFYSSFWEGIMILTVSFEARITKYN